MKVIIIGAGIAGLTVGLACQQAGMQVKIYESAKELRSMGGGILIWPHAMRYLAELSIADELRDFRPIVSAIDIISDTGHPIFHESHDEIYDLIDGEFLPIDRSLMQQLLVRQLATGVLSLNKACVGIDDTGQQAVVKFADGSEDSADLIIGADGVHSAVRRQIFPQVQPTYSGFCWWGGIAESSYVPELPRNHVHFVMGVRKLCSIWPIHGDKFMWYLPVKMPLEQFDASYDGRAQAQGIVTGWNDAAVRLVAAPQCAERFHVPIREMAPLSTYSSGRSVLIGDAACTFGPLLGQGANKAIEDAFVLARLLQADGSIKQKLSRFDVLRHARHTQFFELEHAAATSLMQDSQESLEVFESQLPHISLALMYQDMIPLVNKAACDALIAEAGLLSSMAA